MSLHSDERPNSHRDAMRPIRAVLLLVSALLISVAFAASKNDKNEKLHEMMSYDGLAKITVKGIDLVYTRPGTTLAAYGKVQIDPIEVAFHKDWDPQKIGSRFKLSTSERENIRTGVAKLVHEELVKELQKKSSYQVTDEAGPDVLRLKAIVANLYVNAPDVPTAGRSETYTNNAGEMTLVAELFDSESGQVLARVVDRRAAQDYMVMMSSSSVFNTAEARQIAAVWGRTLRESLDKAHNIGKK